MHQDKFRTGSSSDLYREGWDRIWGNKDSKTAEDDANVASLDEINESKRSEEKNDLRGS